MARATKTRVPGANNQCPSVAQPAPGTTRGRSKDDIRKAAAARQARLREKRKAIEDPEAAAAEAAAKEAAAKEAAAKESAAAAAAAKATRALEAQLVDALAGTAEALMEGVHAVALDPRGPHFGNDRARRIGEAWAPILAPYIQASGMEHLPLILASAGTAGALLHWAGEYRDYKTARGPYQAQNAPPKQDATEWRLAA